MLYELFILAYEIVCDCKEISAILTPFNCRDYAGIAQQAVRSTKGGEGGGSSPSTGTDIDSVVATIDVITGRYLPDQK